MAMGVVEAVRVAGKTDRVKVVSVDGIKDAHDAIMLNHVSGNVAQLPFLTGKRAVELAVEAATTGMHHHSEYTPTPTLTKEMLEHKEDPDLVYLR